MGFDLDVTFSSGFSQKEGVGLLDDFTLVTRALEGHGWDTHDYKMLPSLHGMFLQ